MLLQKLPGMSSTPANRLEADSLLWQKLTQLRDAVVCSEGAKQDSIIEFLELLNIIEDKASGRVAKRGTRNQWLLKLGDFLSRSTQMDDFSEDQLQQVNRFLTQMLFDLESM